MAHKKSKKSSKVSLKIDIAMKDHMRAMQDTFYRKVNPVRAQEVMDSRLIFEDEHAIANLSHQPIVKQWNPNRYCQSLTRDEDINDIGW